MCALAEATYVIYTAAQASSSSMKHAFSLLILKKNLNIKYGWVKVAEFFPTMLCLAQFDLPFLIFLFISYMQ
jgi:hypothetical protein